LLKPVMAQVACAQIAASATNASWAVRATRKVPPDVTTRAALPTAASGEPASIASVVTPLSRVALTDGSRDETSLGDVGPPHPVNAATVPPRRASVACVQKLRRVCPTHLISFMSITVSGRRPTTSTVSVQRAYRRPTNDVRMGVGRGLELATG
jgi:hypothetical protein